MTSDKEREYLIALAQSVIDRAVRDHGLQDPATTELGRLRARIYGAPESERSPAS